MSLSLMYKSRVVGGEVCFHLVEMEAFAAFRMWIVSELLYTFLGNGERCSRLSAGLSRIFVCVSLSVRSFTADQKFCSLGQDQKVWMRVPGSVSHLQQWGGTCG